MNRTIAVRQIIAEAIAILDKTNKKTAVTNYAMQALLIAKPEIIYLSNENESLKAENEALRKILQLMSE